MLFYFSWKFPQRKLGIFLFSNVTEDSAGSGGISFATYDIPIVRMTIANLIVYRGCVPRLKSFSLNNVNISLTKHIWYK